ncbi:Beta-hydroxyacyl-(acyl-carrier-protein) dehydratase FabA/FabZ [Planctopirus limnophila DSM 3776]|uniref:Beta-hydroxyacyl-(Acyl-carrier-protein) dehydratase FabA/FabZ n=1 Tax=Planctopirus limnophila (strain ATCC 43296 / DSM 3776 / IFAM 1008 / Mu 290) TaxID=521674 RepID=D5SU57_PLAL2|nr:3-hydroxyacyl-ACP dehydratase FabZ family protein [Planctopirus limnophila]ADG69110.1 Beta-hydroxyacyl-(acyl-carrier-protein) dehydratase FabA/FabZ [Planctopirus limnophila DSM 3776]
MPAPSIYSMDLVDFDRPIFTLEQIREINPQRFEMEQLTSILYVDTEGHGIIGYKQVTDQEFWVRGHMPGFPLMPGVILCECAAQLAGFYARKYRLLDGDFLGFGGMNEVRFRAPVVPGDRLLIMAKLTRLRTGKRAEFDFQGFVGQKMVYSGQMIGVPIEKDPAKSTSDASESLV